MATLRPLFDSSYTAVGASGANPSGPAFALYRGETSAEFDLELGYPVDPPLDGPVAGQVTVDAGELPSGEALALTHVGAYGSLHESWGRLDAEARRRGLTPAGMLEVYVTQPTPTPTRPRCAPTCSCCWSEPAGPGRAWAGSGAPSPAAATAAAEAATTAEPGAPTRRSGR